MRKLVVVLTVLALAVSVVVFPAGDSVAGSPTLVTPPVRPESLAVQADDVTLGTVTIRSELARPPEDMSYLAPLRSSSQEPFAIPPSQYDLRTLGRLSPVKDQGDCGCCWAFAAYGSLESVAYLTEQWDFSEQNLKNLSGFDWGPCEKGNAKMATAYMARWDGPVREPDDPYDPLVSTSPSGLSVPRHLSSALAIPDRTGSLDNAALKSAVQQWGAVDTGMLWIEGSYKEETHSYYYSGPGTSNHDVAIVGWDDTYGRSNFTMAPPGDGAFIVRNSWGADWGDGGYFYVSYYDTVIGKGNWIFVLETGAPADTHHYGYDELGWIASYGFGDSTAWGANVFTLDAGSGSEVIDQVGFYTTDSGTSYTLRIYGTISGSVSAPAFSGLLTEESGAYVEAGYHTLFLASPVTVAHEQKIAVVVKMTTSGSTHPLAYEYPKAGYSSAASAATGQSYDSSNGTSWSDVTSWTPNANLCIRVFTHDAALPDLTVDTLSFDPTQPIPGGPVRIYFTIRNQGTVPITANYDNKIYVDEIYRTGGTDTNGLAVGASERWHWDTTWPSDTASHTFRIELDPAGFIAESNESNNSASLSASAVPIVYTLTTTASPSAGGTIGRSLDAASYASGAVVTLTANASPGYHFVNWSGDLTGSTNPTTITMTGNKTVTAVFTALLSEGMWTQLPLDAGRVESLAINPDLPTTLYAGTWGGGVFRSTDSGASWTEANTGLTNKYVSTIAINPDIPTTLYAGTGGGGIFRSVNSGDAWTPVNTGLTNLSVWALATNPDTPTTLYAGTDGSGVFCSLNSGTTWTAANAGITTTRVWSLAIDPVTPSRLYADVIGGGVFRSINSGATWTPVNMGLTNLYVWALAVNPDTPTTLYAGTDGAGLFRSTDSGDTWTPVNAGLTTMRISSVVMNPVSPSILYAGTYSGAGVYRSTDSGDHWTPVNAGLTDQNVRSLAIDPVTPTTLYAGAWGGGVFRYDAASYTLMTAASPTAGGSIGRSPDATSYASGTVVTLTASANLGYHFVNWSGDLTGTTNPTTITMTGNKSVTAVFAPTSSSYSLSLLPSWNVIGVPFPTPASSLTTCDLVLSWDGSLWQMATTLTPGTGYLVRNTGGATTVTLTGTPLSSPQTQPATGTWQIIGNPYPTPASFTCTSTVPYLLTWDGSLWQMASPTNLPPGLGFLLQASSPGTITLTSNAAPPSYALTVTPSPLAGGSVGRSPDAASYASGTVVTLTAAAATGYHFVNWSGDLTGTTNPTTITMSTNRSVTAVFQADAIMYALTTTASPSAGGTIGRSPDAASYASGAVVTLTANANPGYHFVNWSGDLTGTTNPTTITMSTNRSVTAVFEANPLPDLTVDTLYFDPAQPTAGGSVTFNFTIRNQGLAPVAADYSVYIYVDGVPVGTGATDTDRLASGASQGWHWNTTWSSDTASHTFMVVLDPTHVVAESNESNNSASLSASAVIGVPETLEPGQETTVPMLTPTFFWSAVPGAARYTFWLGSGWSGSGETEVYSSVVTELSLTLPQALVSGAQYTWNVSAGDASSWGDWGEDQHFTVQVPAGLTVTTLLTPIPYATNVSLTPTFTWTAVPGATRYSFWLGTGTSGSGDTEILGVAVTGTSYTVPAGTLEAGGVCTWNVAVGTATTWGGWTMDRYFMVAP